MITPKLFETLPEEERKLWHSHEYEVRIPLCACTFIFALTHLLPPSYHLLFFLPCINAPFLHFIHPVSPFLFLLPLSFNLLPRLLHLLFLQQQKTNNGTHRSNQEC